MQNRDLKLPEHNLIRQHILQALFRYWSEDREPLVHLPIPYTEVKQVSGALKLLAVRLPEWAADLGVDGELMVPEESCKNENDWENVDWWLAAFLLLECWHERVWESRHGRPIHSYSFRLEKWDCRAWQAAWVNRIALFLRRWVAQNAGQCSDRILGPIPSLEIHVTHDVDAIEKTIPIRLKQCSFNIFNAVRQLLKGEVRIAVDKVNSAIRFLFGREDWWVFDELFAVEKKAGIHAQFNFCADMRRKTLKAWLFDPGYDITQPRLKQLFRKIIDINGTIGLHPTFDAWSDFELINAQKNWLSSNIKKNITACRQHWLRFSWQDTWAAQEQAGIKSDTTLMFNDRPGFRSAAALAWRPWCQKQEKAHELTALPSVFMDSHFYDYRTMNENDRRVSIEKWMQECKFVGGQIAVLWHPHTLASDYGWRQGFETLLEMIDGE